MQAFSNEYTEQNYENDNYEDASQLLTAETRFVEMEDADQTVRDILLDQKTEFLIRDSTEAVGILAELQNEGRTYNKKSNPSVYYN